MTDKHQAEKALMDTTSNDMLLALTSDIVSSYVANNSVPVTELPTLMASVFQSLSKISIGCSPASEARPEPAVPVKKSIMPDYIICLEDGKELKMLKRHLKTAYNMTPDQYRDRWNLPADYPMVAPNYAKQRSKLAKQIGLGTARRTGRSKAA